MRTSKLDLSQSGQGALRILIATPSFPYPPHGGAELRYYHLIRRLARQHKLSLVALTPSPIDERFVEEMRRYCEEVVVVVRHRRPRWRQIPSLVHLLLSGTPFGIKYYNDPQVPRILREMLRCGQYDILQIEHSYFGGVIRALADEHLRTTRTLLTFHNVVHLQDRSILAIQRRPYEFLVALLSWVPMKAWERALTTAFDAYVAMSRCDCEALKSLGEDMNLFMVPNGVDTRTLKPLSLNENSRELLFVGDCSYPPNRDAVLWFSKEIFGRIREAVPDVHLSIVGKGPDHCIRGLADDPSVTVSGYVENLLPFYERAALSIVPLRAGGGTRLKILESMALGRPVVSTSIGCQGLSVTHGQDILIADDPKRFAELAVKLLHDATLQRLLISNARQLVVKEYDWDVIAKAHSEVYQWLVSAEPGFRRKGRG